MEKQNKSSVKRFKGIAKKVMETIEENKEPIAVLNFAKFAEEIHGQPLESPELSRSTIRSRVGSRSVSPEIANPVDIDKSSLFDDSDNNRAITVDCESVSSTDIGLTHVVAADSNRKRKRKGKLHVTGCDECGRPWGVTPLHPALDRTRSGKSFMCFYNINLCIFCSGA